MKTILVVNAGSSSLKFQLFAPSAGLQRLVRGRIDGVGTSPHLKATDPDGNALVDQAYVPADVPDLPAAIHVAGTWLREMHGYELAAVGHRVVHGGPDFAGPVLMNEDVLQRLERYVSLAPLHQPHNLAPIRALLALRPDLPQVACFDTAFHQTQSTVARHYALPTTLYAEGVRRYGFHGLSYEYVSSHLKEVAPEISEGRVIVAHLGSGASMCALSGGRSIESTLGFTALDGLPMGTRCGQLDPGAVLYLLSEKGMTVTEVQDFLYRDCGLKGLSGISNDVRDLLASPSNEATFAIEHFIHRVGLYAGMLAASLGGLDAFVFTAGIGENSPVIRQSIAGKLGWLGATLDPGANDAGQFLVSDRASRVSLLVVPTDEELMIARHTLATIDGG